MDREKKPLSTLLYIHRLFKSPDAAGPSHIRGK